MKHSRNETIYKTQHIPALRFEDQALTSFAGLVMFQKLFAAMRLREREHWLAFLTTLIESRSVRKAATALGGNAKTAFLWRHRFLAWISHDKAKCLRGITEPDETFFLHSEKGNKRLQRTPRKRGGNAQQ